MPPTEFPANPVLRKYLAIWIAQRRRCPLCGGRMRDVLGPSPGEASRDHVHPRSRGGALARNTLLTHRGCNTHKGDRLPYPCELIYLAAINDILEPAKNVFADNRKLRWMSLVGSRTPAQ